MSRPVIILITIVLILALLFATVPALAELGSIPHEDPATAHIQTDAYSFLIYCGDVLDLIALKEYEAASGLLEKLEYVQIPEELRYIAHRYQDLSLELMVAVDELETVLDEASSLLSQYKIDEASPKLDRAENLVGQAGNLLRHLDEARETLTRRLGVLSPSVESKVGQAYYRLQGMLSSLMELREEYDRLLENLRRESLIIEELQPTEVTLRITTPGVFVGESITASGILTSDGEAMPNRMITILINEKVATTAFSDSDGLYQESLLIPYSYVTTTEVMASYMPAGEDQGVYLSSSSPPAQIQTMFYQTGLRVMTPATAYPGLPITVSGEVTPEAGIPPQERQVKLLLDNSLLAETSTQGLFEMEVTLGPQTLTGERELIVVVEAKGVQAGVSRSQKINITRAVPEIDIQAPAFIAVPQTIGIKGRVWSNMGPLQQATVSLELGKASTIVETSTDGEFESTISLPLDLGLVGLRDLEVKVEPSEPWHAKVQAKTSIIIINPANIGLILAALTAIAVLSYTRIRARPIRQEVGIADLRPSPRKVAEVVPPQKPEVEFEGLKQRILGAYIKAMMVVEAATRVTMEPQMTLREFLEETAARLRGAAEAFTELTSLAEMALYSPHIPGIDETLRAEKLATTVEEVLESEAT